MKILTIFLLCITNKKLKAKIISFVYLSGIGNYNWFSSEDKYFYM